MKSIAPKKPAKDQREKAILLALVELYLETGKPIGSNTLKDHGFESMSSATIRNYFVKLEKNGFLRQQHSSGGRLPTEAAFKLYAESHLETARLGPSETEELFEKLLGETREVASYLQRVAEQLSDQTNCAVFLSSPRFDQDYVLDIKLVSLDASRCLCVLLTDFGMVHTETLQVPEGFSGMKIENLSAYLQWRLTGIDKPSLNEKEERIAHRLYREIMLRYIAQNSNFSSEDLYTTGFSKLLSYPDFNNTAALASGLSLFENERDLRALLKKTCESGELTCLIDNPLPEVDTTLTGCSLILIPYRIHNHIAGAIALLGPYRLPYQKLFGTLRVASEAISSSLTKSLYKFKITYRSPQPAHIPLENRRVQGMLTEQKEP